MTACHSVPDHARYIPKDAVVVVGINTSALAKKVAWSKITGSELLEKMESRLKERGQGSVRELEHAGIDPTSTYYAYVVPGSEATGNQPHITGLIPLEDAEDWEAYVKKTFPKATISKAGDHQEAQLNDQLYAGWNDELLVFKNVLHRPGRFVMQADSGFAGDSVEVWEEGAPDQAAMTADMQQAFQPRKEQAITSDRHFTALEKKGHDLTLWVNYEVLMAQNAAAKVMGGLSNTLWKETAIAMGFDFEKGQIDGDMRYYVPENLREVYRKMGAAKLDKNMLSRVSGSNLDGFVAFNYPSSAISGLLEKMGLLGLLNMGLAAQGLSVDDVLGAFSGDMLMAVNDLKVNTKTSSDTAGEYRRSEPELNYLVALKIGDRARFDRLMAFATGRSLLQAAGGGVYGVPNAPKAGTLLVENGYAVFARSPQAAKAFASAPKQATIPDYILKQVQHEPSAFYLNFQTLMAGVDMSQLSGRRDAAIYAETRKLLSYFLASGGGFNSDHLHYQTRLQMVNAEENSLLQLIDFASRVSELSELDNQPVAMVR
jgi:hypothetical protein